MFKGAFHPIRPFPCAQYDLWFWKGCKTWIIHPSSNILGKYIRNTQWLTSIIIIIILIIVASYHIHSRWHELWNSTETWRLLFNLSLVANQWAITFFPVVMDWVLKINALTNTQVCLWTHETCILLSASVFLGTPKRDSGRNRWVKFYQYRIWW